MGRVLYKCYKVDCFVEGLPVPQKQMIPCYRGGKVWLAPPNSKKLKDWRNKVEEVVGKHDPEPGPFAVDLEFRLQRPKNHYKKGGNLKSIAPGWHLVRPDLDNLTKAVCDSLTRCGVWEDDSHVVEHRLHKVFADPDPGVWIRVAHLGTAQVVSDNVPNTDAASG